MSRMREDGITLQKKKPFLFGMFVAFYYVGSNFRSNPKSDHFNYNYITTLNLCLSNYIYNSNKKQFKTSNCYLIDVNDWISILE